MNVDVFMYLMNVDVFMYIYVLVLNMQIFFYCYMCCMTNISFALLGARRFSPKLTKVECESVYRCNMERGLHVLVRKWML